MFLSVLGAFNVLFVTCVPVVLYFTRVEYWSPFGAVPWGHLCGFSVLLLSKWHSAARVPRWGRRRRPGQLREPQEPAPPQGTRPPVIPAPLALFTVSVSTEQSRVTMARGSDFGTSHTGGARPLLLRALSRQPRGRVWPPGPRGQRAAPTPPGVQRAVGRGRCPRQRRPLTPHEAGPGRRRVLGGARRLRGKPRFLPLTPSLRLREGRTAEQSGCWSLNPKSWRPRGTPGSPSQSKGQGSEGWGQKAPGKGESGTVTRDTHFLLFISAFNIVLNFGIAVTYPTLMSLGIVLSVPVNAGKLCGFLFVPVSTGTHACVHTHTYTRAHTSSRAWCRTHARPRTSVKCCGLFR